MCAGTREDGSLIEANDPLWDLLTATAAEARQAPSAWLGMTQIYGDLADSDSFAAAFGKWLTALYGDGVETTVRRYLESPGTA